MFATIFAFLSSWVGILILMAIAAVVWFFIKAVSDFITWFREEILNDPARRNREARNRCDSQKCVNRSRAAGRDSSNGHQAKP